MTSLEGITISRIFIIELHHPTKSNHVISSLTGREKRVIAKSLVSITINPNSTQGSISVVVEDLKSHIAIK